MVRIHSASRSRLLCFFPKKGELLNILYTKMAQIKAGTFFSSDAQSYLAAPAAPLQRILADHHSLHRAFGEHCREQLIAHIAAGRNMGVIFSQKGIAVRGCAEQQMVHRENQQEQHQWRE